MIRARGAVSVDYLNPLLLDGKVLRDSRIALQPLNPAQTCLLKRYMFDWMVYI